MVCEGILALATAKADSAARSLQQAYDKMLQVDVSFVLERSVDFSPLLSLFLSRAVDPAIRPYAEQLLSKCREREKPSCVSRASDATKRLLTDRERSIVQFIAGGQSNKQIARTLGVAPETVKTHVKRIFVKLSAESRTQAVVRAQSLGLIRNLEIH